jgi:hypothetical protein
MLVSPRFHGFVVGGGEKVQQFSRKNADLAEPIKLLF